MALVTWNSNMPKLWKRLFEKKVLPSVRPRKRSGNVYRFRTKGRAFQNRQGPGRKTKNSKNTTITHL